MSTPPWERKERLREIGNAAAERRKRMEERQDEWNAVNEKAEEDEVEEEVDAALKRAPWKAEESEEYEEWKERRLKAKA